MSKNTKKESAEHVSRKPFVLMWAEEASVDSLSDVNRVFSGSIEGTSEEYRRARERGIKRS